MRTINQHAMTTEAIEALRRMADMLESGDALISSGEVSESSAYGEPRIETIQMSVIVCKECEK